MGAGLFAEPVTGLTPRRAVWRRGKAVLYRYASAPRHRTPVLFVPHLGIAPPYIFDLIPGSSFVEHMTREGFDFHLLDWGRFGPEDDDLTFEDAVAGTLARAWRTVRETAGAEAVTIIGYSMGAAMAAALAAARPELPLRAFIDMAGAIDFSKAGLLARWLRPARLEGRVPGLPPALLWIGGLLAQPALPLSVLADVIFHAGDERRMCELRAVAKWNREFFPIPGEFFRQLVRDFYQDNRLFRGTFSLAGRPARLQTISCPVLALAAAADALEPPESVRALLDAVGSRDRTFCEVPGAHLALALGTEAEHHAWPTITGWLAPRS